MSDNYTEETKPLFKLLRTEAFRFVIVRYNNYFLVQRLEKDLQVLFPQRPFKIIRAPETDYWQLTETYYELKNGFLLVEEFEDVLKEEQNDTNNPAVAQNNQRKKDITAGLNLRRDKLARFPIALIVCVPASTGQLYAKIVMEKMPDLWSFRSLILDLKIEEEKDVDWVAGDKIEQKITLDENIESVLLSDANYIAEKRKELVRLQNLLSKAPETEREYRVTLYPQIVDLQIEIGEYHEALDSLQAWETIAFAHDKANIWVKKGDVFTTIGSLDKALVFFEKAEVAFGQNDDKYSLALCLGRIGSTQSALGNLERALTYFEGEVVLFKQLYETFPNNVSFKNGLAISYERLGSTHNLLGNFRLALNYFMEYNNLEKQLHEADISSPEFKNGLAISYSKLGEMHNKLGDLKQALTYFELCSKLVKQLYDNFPYNVEYKYGLAMSYERLGSINNSIGNLKQALNYFEDFENLIKQLYRSYPNNVNFKNSLAISYQYLGNMHSALDNLEQASTYLENFVELMKQLYKSYPNNVNFKKGLAISCLQLGLFYQEKNSDKGKAKLYIEQCKKLFLELLNDFPLYEEFKNNLAWVEQKLAENLTLPNSTP